MLKEFGFWDYTTPGAGGMEHFRREDYDLLLDDMAGGGMNSLMICVKWFTTGYRSRLPFLDQVGDNPIIASDNEVLRWVIEESSKRGIKVWLGACLSLYCVERFGGQPHLLLKDFEEGFSLPFQVGGYASDLPEIGERGAQVVEEIVDLFPGIGGIEIELEESGYETPQRIPRYNAWAEKYGRRQFEELGHPFQPRAFEVPEWRDYTTDCRVGLAKTFEKAARAKGFGGDLSIICETGVSDYCVFHEVNLKRLRAGCPDWVAVTYEYDKANHRKAMMDFCIEKPMEEGFPLYYLARGVMTWGGEWPRRLSLEESWKRDVADVQEFAPDGFWWFGCGCVGEGWHVGEKRLRQSGYKNGVEARRALIDTCTPLGR